MKKCIIIYNPNSGKVKLKKHLPEIEKLLLKNNYNIEVYSTKYKGEAINIVENLKNVDLVMSFGGDGTFNEVMTGNLQRKTRLLLTHIPVGTTNDIGAMLGYSKNNILENIKLSLTGTVKKFDIGIINNHPFIYVAGFGKYMNISYETPRDMKKKIGQFAYIEEGIKTFFNKTKLYDISYEINGEKYRGLFSFILVSNANHIAGIPNVYKDIKLDDNQLEVVFCTIKKKKDILKSLFFLTKYDASKVPGLFFYRTNNIKIEINNKDNKSWCVDGEKLINNSLIYNISLENNVEILIPKKNINKLFINNGGIKNERSK